MGSEPRKRPFRPSTRRTRPLAGSPASHEPRMPSRPLNRTGRLLAGCGGRPASRQSTHASCEATTPLRRGGGAPIGIGLS